MNLTIKSYTLFCILIVAMVLGCSYYRQSSEIPTKHLPIVSTAQEDHQTDVTKQESLENQTIVDLTHEIVSLKTDIKRINNQLTQLNTKVGQSTKGSNAQATLSTEELQIIETSQDDNEATNEMNRVQSGDKVEDYFSQLPGDANNDSKKEAAVKQSLLFDQGDMASILDVHCKTSLCRVELQYSLSDMQGDGSLEEDQHVGYSTVLSSLLDVAVSQDINEADQTAVAVIFLGQAEVDLSLDQR